MRDFMYGIKSVSREVSEQLINDENLPHIQHSTTYEPYTYFFDGRVGYDVPVDPATQGAEAGESLEPRRWRLQ